MMTTEPPATIGRRALLAGAATLLGTATAAAKTERKTIRVGVNKGVVFAPSLLLGTLVGADFDIVLSYFNSPADLTNAMLAGSIEAGYTGVTIAALGRSKGEPLVIVSNAAGKGSAMIVRASGPIRSVAEFKGKRVGQVVGGIQDILLREELRKAGMTLRDIAPVSLAPPDLGPALQRGDIDAFCSGEPFSTQTLVDGYGRLLLYPYDTPVGTINGAIVTTDDAAKKNRPAIAAIVAAHAKAAVELQADKDKCAALVAKDWGFNQAVARRSLDNVELLSKIDDQFVAEYVAYMNQLNAIGFLGSVPDVHKLVNRSFVA
jgi:NitT/TauT family transport system substrate-binding protein